MTQDLANDLLQEQEDEQNYNQDINNEEYQENTNDNFLGSIAFSINKQGQLFVECFWSSFDDGTASKFGEFLHMLNDGKLSPNIMRYLVEVSSSNLSLNPFIVQILTAWENKTMAEYNTPIIEPTNVFKVLNNESKIT